MNDKRPRRLLETVSARLDLPTDLVAGLSRVELLVPDGHLLITGREMTIRRMDGQELVVDGRFTGLQLQEGGT